MELKRSCFKKLHLDLIVKCKDILTGHVSMYMLYSKTLLFVTQFGEVDLG